MGLIRRTSPFADVLSLRQAMDRLLEDSFVRPRSVLNRNEGMTLPLDIQSTPDALIVEAALPGVKPENVEVTINGDTLTFTGNNEVERTTHEDGYLHQEIRRGSVTRAVTLPPGLKTDQLTANFENGVLRLSIPKAQETKPRRISITSTSKAAAQPTEAVPAGDGQKAKAAPASSGSGVATS